MEYKSDDDLLSGPQLGLSGFLDPETAYASAPPGFSSPGSASAASFGSPSRKNICPHGRRKDTCKECWKQYNDDRISKGLEPEAFGIFCKHGINKFMKNSCTNPECIKQRGKLIAYAGQESEPRVTMQFLQPTGVIPDSARMFEPPIPKSAGLSFSPLEASQVNPVTRNLFETRVFDSSDDEMREGGGRRKSSKKSKRKSSKKSKRKLSKKAKKLKRR
jgi:hypothetical protein